MRLRDVALGIASLVCILAGPSLAGGTARGPDGASLTVVDGQWTWIGGSDRVADRESYGVYGTKGVPAPGNAPGARDGSVSWRDASGNFWLFGGLGYSSSGRGVLNDLWKWDGASWAWMSGSDTAGQRGLFGTRGVAAPDNVPGARFGSVSWTDASGNLWLFGGRLWPYDASGYLNDLWKWDGTNWTWEGGSTTSDQPGTYGTRGVAAPENVPGARRGAISWRDSSGAVWLFGGLGYSASGYGDLNDLWKWDGTSWTWVSGPSGSYQYGTYGTKGVAAPGNVPGARHGSGSWTDATGNLWLFGGSGLSATGSGRLNDLWKWDGTSWTWVSGSNGIDETGVYGTRGAAAPGNAPGAREGSVAWVEPAGSVWLFGGLGYSASGQGYLNDLWKWDGTNWIWVSGSSGSDDSGTPGLKGVAAPGNVPGARVGSVSWRDASGNLWLFGGYGFSASGQGYLNALCRWDGTTWTWISGASATGETGTYGTKGVAAPGNMPGARNFAVSWTDSSGNLLLFGGAGYAASGSGLLNDLWKWDGSSWAWLSGSDAAGQRGSYGAKGVAAPENVPGARRGAVSWTDVSGNLWLFGGVDTLSGTEGLLNDLWKWNGTTWTWVSGSSAENEFGVYGTKGVAAPGNVPGARVNSVSWTDGSGNLWLFGGFGYSEANRDYLNDLWKWDGAAWTWVSGSVRAGALGSYGSKGAASSGNVPGAREFSVSWTDPDGSLWLFGGWGYSATGNGELNDLWKWDGTSWTWVSGSSAAQQVGTYGVKGMPAAGNVPGARSRGVSWTDAIGNLWLFGGDGISALGEGYLNDLWRWDGTNWAWMGGSAMPEQAGTYGTVGVAAAESWPGARRASISWRDANGSLWLFGGFGRDAQGRLGWLSDFWTFGMPCTPSRPTASNGGPYGIGTTIGLTAWTVPGASYAWTGPNGFTSSLQNPTIPNATTAMSGAYGVTVTVGGCTSAPGTTTVTVNDSWPLTVTKAGVGQGTVSSSVPGISCGGTCSASFAHGDAVVLTALADYGSLFTGWSGEGCGGTGPCTVSMTRARFVTATFDLDPSAWRMLDVTTLGGGSVKSSPAGISCPGTCRGNFLVSSTVTLTATSFGFRFGGWAGGGCTGIGTCTVTLDTAKTVSAWFYWGAASRFYAIAPCRAVDTRSASGPLGGPAMDAGATRSFQIAGSCGIPVGALAVSLNVTVADATAPGSLTLFPGAGPVPDTNTISFVAGKNRAANSVMGLIDGRLSAIDRQSNGTVHLVIDVNGYYYNY